MIQMEFIILSKLNYKKLYHIKDQDANLFSTHNVNAIFKFLLRSWRLERKYANKQSFKIIKNKNFLKCEFM